MFELRDLKIPGCCVIQPQVIQDYRGRFVKIFHEPSYIARGLEVNFKEEFYSHSRKDVVRGMHFQMPPCSHVKVVYCVSGEVFDVVLDLRRGSPTYGQFDVVNLSSDTGDCIYIPKGVAHGFLSLTNNTILVYKLTTIYEPSFDCGVAWNSFGLEWPTHEPILSERDQALTPLSHFESPFEYAK
jgi:dTDP-4-dehydrorhamnose 3,5-epimerase